MVTLMRKNPRVRTIIDTQHVKGFETLLIYTRLQFWDIVSLLWNNFSSKNSVLVVSEMLRLFDNLWTPDDKYCL